ncbi:MAG: heme lyase CcmF/NrfE family subunit [Thermoleophilia bacterium]|nr:heme lyase CcmF/NrfE family subunit [Thermoleophilia bacterium]
MSLLGRALLLLALLAAAYAVGAALLSRQGGRRSLQRSAERAVYAVCALVSASALLMIGALVTDDFKLRHVAEYSSSTLALKFKISALWASQAGSLLLWAWIMSCYAALAVWLNRRRSRELMPVVTAVLMVIAGFFLVMLSFLSSPFETLAVAPAEGRGLNPLLQNEYMMAHPPLLYLGYVGLAIPFAFAIAALVTRRLDTQWIGYIRRWTVVSWLFLGVGILLGSRWAYHELGWGGYWAWDPVENAAFMPWLVATAFLHSVMVQERRGMLKVWNMVLVILTFILALFGTFLTRSGIVASVHAFGESTLGPFFLGFILVALGGSLALLFTRLPELRSRHSLESYISREAIFLYNNLLLVGLAFAVFWGTIFPVITEAVQGEKITVGVGFYNQVAMPIGIALLILTGVGPLIPWRKASGRQLLRRFAVSAGIAVASIPVLALLTDAWDNVWAGVVFTSAVFVTACVTGEFLRGTRVRHALGGVSWPGALVQLVQRNRRRYGGYIVHLGVVILFIGLAGSNAFTTERDFALKKGERGEVAGYTIVNEGFTRTRTDHKGSVTVQLGVFEDGERVATLRPARDFYFADQQPSTEVALDSGPSRDLYAVLGGLDEQGLARVSIFVNPLVMWLWIAGVVIFAGGLVAAWPGPRVRRQEQESPSALTGVAR